MREWMRGEIVHVYNVYIEYDYEMMIWESMYGNNIVSMFIY